MVENEVEIEQLPAGERSDRALAERFRRFARDECSGDSGERAGSPTYETLCETVADSPRLLGLARQCRVGQPIPNLFFAAVKRLAMSYTDAELARRYECATHGEQPAQGLGSVFTEFALAHQSRILKLLGTRLVLQRQLA